MFSPGYLVNSYVFGQGFAKSIAYATQKVDGVPKKRLFKNSKTRSVKPRQSPLPIPQATTRAKKKIPRPRMGIVACP